MDRAIVAGLDTDRIPNALDSGGHNDRWERLVERAGNDAAHVLKLVCRVAPPERISELRDLEVGQSERGAGFLGMLPDQVPADLEAPDDLEASLDVAIRLSEIRTANLAASAETMPLYPLSFAGNRFDPAPTGDVPTGWRLDIDVDGIRAVLDLFDAPESAAPSTIAGMPAFVEMMRHRRELGYVPEPLIDEDGLAWCLMHAASSDPIDQLWKWLHPQNLFDLSDLYAHRTEYRRLIDGLVQGDRLATYILGRIAPYAPPDVAFVDRLSFAIGWGIRGWATRSTGGMNIEHAKDDFELLLSTLVHETFHRLQVSIARANPETEESGFDRVTSYPFESPADRRLYQALCYVMLEGSATYVASRAPSEAWKDNAKAGLELLERIREIDTSEDEDDKGAELFSEGLRSNGPFYGFGALLSDAFIRDGGPSSLGAALGRGAPEFLDRGLTLIADASLAPPEALATHIAHLRAELERGTQQDA
jgi:hypothetical protein